MLVEEGSLPWGMEGMRQEEMEAVNTDPGGRARVVEERSTRESSVQVLLQYNALWLIYAQYTSEHYIH